MFQFAAGEVGSRHLEGCIEVSKAISKLSGKEGHGGSLLTSSGFRNPNLEDLECRFLMKYEFFPWRNVSRPDYTVSGAFTE